MLQDLETSIENTKEIADSDKEKYISRLYETVCKYGTEALRDLKEINWRSQVGGGLSAGYLLCFLGKEKEAHEFFKRALEIHRNNRNEYSKHNSIVLEYVINALEEFGYNSDTLSLYKSRLKQEKEKEREKPKDLKRQIIHIDADLECETGDLESRYAQGRREQGELYGKLGEHKKAIEYFQKAIGEDKRDWRKETSIKNKLSIVDSYLALNDLNSAQKEFMELIRDLFPNDINLGDKMPELFTENLGKLDSYFKKLGLEDYLEKVAKYAEARLENLKGLIKPPSEKEDSKEKWKRTELCDLSEILADYHVGKGEYQKASDIFDKGREYLEYKHHLCMREQAEFAIRAGNKEKAMQLIKQDEAEKLNWPFSDERKPFELTNLYLQLGDIDSALAKLDGFCEDYKRHLASGSYNDIFETRNLQIGILKRAIGKDYAERLRRYAETRNNIFKEPPKFAPLKEEGKKKN